jgi:hypothetical protein
MTAIKNKPGSDADYKVCRTCFFSNRFPGITINKSGECNLCANHTCVPYIKSQTDSSLEELRDIAEKIKQKRTGKYDCIIGASGGLDSSYVIYVAKKMLGLNPFVISYDHGFVYDIAKENLKAICKNLGVDLTVVSSKKRNNFQHVKYLTLALENIGVYWGFCQFCRYLLPAVLYKYALEENITTMLVSSNGYEQVGLFKLPAKAKLKSMIDGAFKPFRPMGLLKFIYYYTIALYYLLKLKLEFYAPPFMNIFRRDPELPKMEKINITKYVPWNIDAMIKTMGEAGWKTPDPMFPMRFDCKIDASFINFTYKKTFGLNCHAMLCHNVIADGTRTKQQLTPTVEFHDSTMEENIKEMRASLGLEPGSAD